MGGCLGCPDPDQYTILAEYDPLKSNVTITTRENTITERLISGENYYSPPQGIMEREKINQLVSYNPPRFS